MSHIESSKKFEIGKENNSIIFSRKQLWKSRIGEFMESPVVGIGFTNATLLLLIGRQCERSVH